MTVNKKKKKVNYRGSKTHGCGSMKKRRGAGHRGGRGAAGSGKRGDCKKPSIWKGRYFGKLGFKTNNPKINSINLKEIEIKIPKWLEQGLIKENKEVFQIDLNMFGYDKLLSTGEITKKLNIKVSSFSNKAAEKIKNAGGDIQA